MNGTSREEALFKIAVESTAEACTMAAILVETCEKLRTLMGDDEFEKWFWPIKDEAVAKANTDIDKAKRAAAKNAGVPYEELFGKEEMLS